MLLRMIPCSVDDPVEGGRGGEEMKELPASVVVVVGEEGERVGGEGGDPPVGVPI